MTPEERAVSVTMAWLATQHQSGPVLVVTVSPDGTNHHRVSDDLVVNESDLRSLLVRAIRDAVAEEREACAAVPEDHLRVCNLTAEHEAGNPPRACHWHCHKAIAAAIRART